MIIKQYFKQVFKHLQSQPLLSSIQVLGSALAIFMIMAYVLMEDIQVESFAPESYRDRYLHVPHTKIQPKDTSQHWMNCSNMSNTIFRKCFKDMKTPEAVACYTSGTSLRNVGVAKGESMPGRIKYCSEGFWRVFNFTFLDGRPFNEAEAESGIRIVVITKSVALRLFGSIDVCSKDIVINRAPFRIVGVVEDVSPIALNAFADIWAPYGIADTKCTWNSVNSITGSFVTTILARSANDFDAIREETKSQLLKFNESWSETEELDLLGQPYDQKTYTYSYYFWGEDPTMDHFFYLRLVIIFCLLIVPAINLSSMTQSHFRQRIIEIGVRRAFGSTRYSILNQVFFENLILTILSGALGFLFCLLLARFGGDLLFESGPLKWYSNSAVLTVDMSMLMHASTFLFALLFCFILNAMSSIIPAWRASRTQIILALNKN